MNLSFVLKVRRVSVFLISIVGKYILINNNINFKLAYNAKRKEKKRSQDGHSQAQKTPKKESS